MSQLLIIANTPSPNTLQLRQAVVAGVAATGLDYLELDPSAAHAGHVLHCRGIILGTTENFGYMSGAIKDFFERIYYPCLEQTQGLSVATYVRAGLDGTGAINSMERILGGLRWNPVQEPLLLKGEHQPVFLEYCRELGEAMGEGLKLGIF
ncbi:MAG: flavodoxin family protein [Thiothrix sp.]|nr:flavodoxin family protein [Thiothrix sp.]HPQ94977.1 flavodoxin family protein [Thiolinea sp.]